MRLTICGLGRDSAATMQRYLTCVNEVADEILLGNQGLPDDALTLARSKGARIIDLESTTDFSAMRNQLIDQATGDWILMLDCHETIPNPDLRRLKDFLADTAHDVFILPVRNYTKATNLMGWRPSDRRPYTGYVPARQARVFRKHDQIRYHYPVNETLLPSVNKTSLDVKEITDITINNYDYDNQIESHLELLRELKKEHPEDMRITYDLALATMRTGRLGTASRLFKEVVEVMPTYRNALTNLATLALKKGDHYLAAKLFLQAIDHNPRDLNAYHNLGQLFWQNKHYDKAEYLFKKALTVDPREPRLIVALARTYSDSGRPDDAKDLLERGLAMLPDHPLLTKALGNL